MSELRTIKKYPNRRLYDTSISQYVTLQDIRELVVNAVPFKVIDAKSQDDLTRQVLLQIICEQEDRGDPILSVELLSRIIRLYGDTLQGVMGAYLDKSMASFLAQQTQLRKQLDSLMETTPLSVMSDMADHNMKLWQSLQDAMLAAYQPPAAPTPKRRAAPDADDP